MKERIRRVFSRWSVTPHETLISAVILLVTIGTVMIFSASFFHHSVGGDPYFYLRRHAVWIAVAVPVGFVAARVDYRILNRVHHWILLGTVVLLALVFVPGLGFERNGASRWIRLGVLNFQPSELAKLSAVIFVAGFLANRPERVREFWRGFALACSGIFLLVGLILIEPDFGTAMFVLLVSGVLFLVAGVKVQHCCLVALPLIPVLSTFIVWRWEQIRPRLLALIEPEKIYQVKQSLLSLGAGGFFGAGIGAGGMKLKYLPEPQTDFIFSVIGEELGFVGGLGVIFLFLVLIHSGATIARRARDGFGFLLASGIVISLGSQAAFNLAVVTASAPTKGIPLPFITFGGSGLVMTFAQIGLLLSVDRQSRSALAGPDLPEPNPS